MTTRNLIRSGQGHYYHCLCDKEQEHARFPLPLFVSAIDAWFSRYGMRETICNQLTDVPAARLLARRGRLRFNVPPDEALIARWVDWHRNEWPRVYREVSGLALQPFQIVNAATLKCLQERDGADGPPLEWLLAEAQRAGLTGDERFSEVAKWGCSGRIGKELEALDSDRSHTRRMKEQLAVPRQWQQTEDLDVPWVCGELSVRLNDFPDESMYSLSSSDTIICHFDDWPKVWTRPKVELIR